MLAATRGATPTAPHRSKTEFWIEHGKAIIIRRVPDQCLHAPLAIYHNGADLSEKPASVSLCYLECFLDMRRNISQIISHMVRT